MTNPPATRALYTAYLKALRENDVTRLDAYRATEEDRDRMRQGATAAHNRYVVARIEAMKEFSEESK